MGQIHYADGENKSAPIILTDNSTQLVADGATATQSGVISESGGSHSLQIDAGLMIFTANNTYTGTTVVDGGHLQIGDGGTSGSLGSGDVHINVVGILEFDRSDTITVANNISTDFGGSFIQKGTGTVILTGTTASNVTAVVWDGTLQVGNGGTGGSVGNGVVDDAAVVIDHSDDYHLNIGGTGTLTQAGSGTLFLTNNGSTFTGSLTISAGTVQIADSGTTNLLFGNGSITDNSHLTITGTFTGGTISDVISGSGDVTFATAGAEWFLTGNQTYTGTTNITAGEVFIGSDSAHQQTGGGTSGSISGNMVLGSTTSVSFDRSDNVTYGGQISGAGNVAQVGSGVLTLTGTNSYTGLTDTLNGTLAISSDSNLGTGDIRLDSGSIRYLASMTTALKYQLGFGAFDTNGHDIVASGNIVTETDTNVSQGDGGLTKIGAGTLTLTGSDTFDGISTISAGTLALSGTGSLSSASDVVDNASLDISQTLGASLQDLTGSGAVHLGARTLTISSGGGGATDVKGNVTGVFSGVIQDGGIGGGTGGGLTLSGGTLYLSGTNTYTGITTIASGAGLVVGNNTATGSLGSGNVSDNGTLVFYRTGSNIVANNISGAGALAQSGSGDMALTGTNTYTGVTTIALNTVLRIGNSGTTGTLGSGAVSDSGSLQFWRSDNISVGNVISGSGGLIQAVGGVLTLTAADSYSGSTYIYSTLGLSGSGSIANSAYVNVGGTFDISGTSSGASVKAVADSGTIALGSKTLTITGAEYAFSGVIQDGGIAGGTGGGLTLSGGTEYLSGNNLYTGLTTIASGATLLVGGGVATGSLGSGDVYDNGSLYYWLTSDTSVANTISGSGNFSQGGSGTLTLTGTNTYSGATYVNDGTLLVNGSTVAPTFVNSRGTLGGTGTVGTADVASGGVLAAGSNGVGTLNINGSLTLESGATDQEDISTGGADETMVSSTASISGKLAVNFAAGSYAVGTTYTIVNSLGVLSGGFTSVSATGLAPGEHALITYDTHNVYLTVAADGPSKDLNGDGDSDLLWQGSNSQPAVWLMNGATPVLQSWVGNGSGWRLAGAGDFSGDGHADMLLQSTTSGQAEIWLMNGATILSQAAAGVDPGPSWHVISAGDFNDDGDADILWQNSNGQVAVWLMNGATPASQTVLGYNPGPSWHVKAAGDFDGDGKADILWQNDSGQASIWLMDGTTPVNQPPGVGVNPGASWHVIGAGDFDGDGKDDILWQNDNSQVAIWLMNGITPTSQVVVGPPDAGMKAMGTADINGDGKADILFQNSSGQTQTWLMNSTNKQSQAGLGAYTDSGWKVIGAGGSYNADGYADLLLQNANGQIATGLMGGPTVSGSTTPLLQAWTNQGTGWRVVDSGDFNRDGQTDTLLQSTVTGQAEIWLMNGTTVLSQTPVSVDPGPVWHVISSGDFDGDGKSDILWQNSNGQAAIWLMNGTTPTAQNLVDINPGGSWHVKGSGDFDGDGKADILWQNDSGQAAIWLMNGTTPIQQSLVSINPGASWHLKGAGDFNGDGKSDILLQNDSGQAAIWLMNGTTPTQQSLVDINPGPSWHVMGAGDVNGDGKADILWQNDDGRASVWLMNGTAATAQPYLSINSGSAFHLAVGSGA